MKVETVKSVCIFITGLGLGFAAGVAFLGITEGLPPF